MNITPCRLIAFFLMVTACSCSPEQAFYMSPSDVRATPYPTLPMAADSQRTITTGSLAFQGGSSGDQLKDNLTGGSASIMQSHHFGHFQGYYGAVFGAGNYQDDGGTYYSPDYNGFDSGVSVVPGRNRFYGYYGANAGANVVVPFADASGEWRAIGIDLGYRHDFGQYLDFRKKLDPEIIDLVAAYNHFFTIGGSSEILARNRRHNVQFSYRIAAGGMIYPHNQYKGYSNGSKPYYFSHTLALTKNRVTGYVQVTGGTHAVAIQIGTNISLRRQSQALPAYTPPRSEEREKVRQPRRHPPRPFERRRNASGD